MGRLVEIQRDVGLPLMVCLMPNQDLQPFADRDAALSKAWRDHIQFRIRETSDGGRYVFACLLKNAADFGDGWYLIIGSAASFKPRNQVGEARDGSAKSFGREEFFGNADMQQLPGDMCSAWARPPSERMLRIRQFFDGFESRQSSVATEGHQ